MQITSTKGTVEISNAYEARNWFNVTQPSYADIDGIEVAARFDGESGYYMTDGDASLDLGICEDLGNLAAAVAITIMAGDADWSGWEVIKG